MSKSLKTRLQKSLDGRYKFLLSGLPDDDRTCLAKKIQELGALYIDSECFHPNCTHIVCGKLSRSEKFLGACAMGKWVLHPDFIIVSAEKGIWQDEEKFEWVNYQVTNVPMEMVMAARRWRFHIDAYRTCAFSGWKTAVIVRGAKKSSVYNKLLTYGGADVYKLKLPMKNPGKVVNQLTFVFVGERSAYQVLGLMDYGILCLKPEYIGDYLIKDPPPDPIDYLVKSTKYVIPDSPSLDINLSINNSEKDILCSQVTMLTSDNLSLKSKRSNTCTLENGINLDLTFTESSTKSDVKSADVSSVQSSNVLSAQSSNVLSAQSSNISSVQSSNVLSIQSSSASSVRSSNFLSAQSSHDSICCNKPSTSNLAKKRKILELDLDGAVQQMKRQKVGHSRFVWRPRSFVGMSAMQVEERSQEPETFSGHLTGMIHTSFDDDGNDSVFLLAALDLLMSSVTTRKIPQPQTMYMIMTKILLTKNSSVLVNKGHCALMKIVQLHPPVTPFVVQLYMNSFRDKKSDIDLDRGQEEWKFIRTIIETVIQSGLDSEEPCSPVKGHLLNLKYIIALLEQNMKYYLNRIQENDCSVNKLRTVFVSQIMWTSLTHGSLNNRCRELMDLFGDCISCNLVLSAKIEVLNLILSLITMITNVCYIGECGGRPPQNHYISTQSKTSGFIHQIAGKINGHDMPFDVLKSILWGLQPPWLSLNVCCELLNSMDDYLVSGEIPKDKISLQMIVSQHFYLLPKLETKTCPTPAKSPHKKGLMRSTLKNLSSNSSVNKDQNMVRKIGHDCCANVTKILTPKMVNKKNGKGETPLHIACIKNNVLKVKQLLRVPGIDINAKDNAGWTPLHEACNHGNVECVKELLNFVPAKTVEHYFSKGEQKCKKVDLLASTDELITPLHDAVLNDRIDVCKLLLQHGGPSLLKHKTIINNTPLDLATTDVMRELLNSYIDDSFANKSLSQDSTFSELSQDGHGPSDYLYDHVFSNGQFSDSLQCSKYIAIVLTTLRSYLDIIDLKSLKNAMDISQENTKPQVLNVTRNNALSVVQQMEQTSSRSSSPLGSNSVNISNNSKQNNTVTVASSVASNNNRCDNLREAVDDIKADLKTLKRLKGHIRRFENHIRRICKPEDFLCHKLSMNSFYCLEENCASLIENFLT